MLAGTVFKFEIPLFSSERIFEFKIFLMTLEAAKALVMVSFQSCLGQGALSFTLRSETAPFDVFLCWREPLLIHNNRISSSALPPFQISFTGGGGCSFNAGYHTRPRRSFISGCWGALLWLFSCAPRGVKALFASANWAGVCVGRLSSHTGPVLIFTQGPSSRRARRSWRLRVCWNSSALELNCSSWIPAECWDAEGKGGWWGRQELAVPCPHPPNHGTGK